MSDETPTPESPVQAHRAPRATAGERAEGDAPAERASTEPAASEPAAPEPVGPEPVEPERIEPEPVAPVTKVPVAEVPVAASPVAAEPVALVEPVLAEPVTIEPATSISTTGEQPRLLGRQPRPGAVQPTAVQPTAEHLPGAGQPGGVQTVFLHPPQPPKRRGNRAGGTLIALASAVLFGVLYAIVLSIIIAAAGGRGTVAFLGSIDFYVPVLFFAGGFILVALIVNRAGWWVHVIASILVGLFVYFGTVGTGLLIGGVVLQTPQGASRLFGEALVNPFVIAAALLAREVALWMGAIIAARGRRLKARNAQDRADYETEVARQRADYERAVTEARARAADVR